MSAHGSRGRAAIGLVVLATAVTLLVIGIVTNDAVYAALAGTVSAGIIPLAVDERRRRRSCCRGS